MMTTRYDVAVIGGGPAGLSAAVALGRSRRSVIVLDAGAPRNARAQGVHNFLSREGMPPGELLAAGRAEVEHYGGVLLQAEALRARSDPDGFEIQAALGQLVRARHLIVASGLADELPDLPGVRELWGSDVLHCPYCHGWEVADQPIGVLATGPMAVHQSLMFRQLTDDVVHFEHIAPLTAEDAEKLAARGIDVITGVVDRLEIVGGRLAGIELSDGRVIKRSALVVGPRMVARSTVLDSLGLVPVPHPAGAAFGEYYEADPAGRTSVPGVWLAGNVTDIQAQVIVSAGRGLMVGAMVNAELIAAETQRAVDAARVAVA
jgi:thioredoxin reductase